jgi:hypothetical protein
MLFGKTNGKLRAFIVCVDYWDYLSITLPRNLIHFDEVNVITSCDDSNTKELCKLFSVPFFQTNSFYDDGASFNKWKALEEGFDYFGRHEWICILDSDIVLPPIDCNFAFSIGNLYSPRRRMMRDVDINSIDNFKSWRRLYDRDNNREEFSGYMQVFHSSDPRLPVPPWHQKNWRHAGGADTFFQDRWPKQYKKRLPFDVLHLGDSFTNWFGRRTKYLNGSTPKNAEEKESLFREMIRMRKKTGGFSWEKT